MLVSRVLEVLRRRKSRKHPNVAKFFNLTSHAATWTISPRKFAALGLADGAQSCKPRFGRAICANSKIQSISEVFVKKTTLFVLLLLVTVFGTGTASFAACSATSLSNGTGVWGLEAYGSHGATLDNILIQAKFVGTSPSGTFTGTEWQSLSGTLSSFAISGTWSMTLPVTDCQGTITVTSPSTQTFSFAINNSGKGLSLTQVDAGYTIAGLAVAQATTLTCSATVLKSKAFSLYSNGNITGLGLVTGSGEIKFATSGTTFASSPTVSLDLGSAGNYIVTATGTATVATDCTGTGTLVATSLGQTFDVDLVIVGTGNEALWIVTNAGDNVTGYFLQ
jgi:hypothetical protein